MNRTQKICIIGGGTYGSYLLRRLLESRDDLEVTVVEVGDTHTRSEAEIGFRSHSEHSKAAALGRYFGWGGTSAKWGGQILFFDERDNPRNDPDWARIVAINQRHKRRVLDRLLGGSHPERFHDADHDMVKTGIWLRYFRRNLFRHLSQEQLRRVELISGFRVVDWELEGEQVRAVRCRDVQGKERRIEADRFYLTAGAIESCRLLLELRKKVPALQDTDLGRNFGDHVSVELCRVFGPPRLDGEDFRFTFFKGSMVTKRIVVHTADGRVGYLHFVFNKEVAVFNSLKQFLFGRQRNTFVLGQILRGVPFLLRTLYEYLFRRRLHVHRVWSLQLDMEQDFPNPHRLELDPQTLDRFGVPAVRIQWSVSPADVEALREGQRKGEELLRRSGLPFERVFDSEVAHDKIEDIYHPVGFIRLGSDPAAPVDFRFRVRGTANLFHFSTALFPSARSINPTAAGLCLVEEHLEDFSGNFKRIQEGK